MSSSPYKSTLNLPITEFAMKANLAHREVHVLKKWQDTKLYQQICDKNKNKKVKFILHDGPPYANGDIHIGHAVNKVLKDIIVKEKSLAGFNAPYIPGWDCHGLPIEHNIEKKKGKAGHKISASDFRAICRKYAQNQADKQSKDFQRLGILGDWDNPYLTKDFKYEADIVRAFGKIIENGHLLRGYKPVHWCIECVSALAEAEVEYKNRTSPAVYVNFRIIDNSIFDFNNTTYKNKPISVVIWTTTPWTLPASEAVTLHPELDYVLVIKDDEYLLVAKDCLYNKVISYDYISKFVKKGKELEGVLLQHPFYNKILPIILGEHVTTNVGTGAVHTAPAHGQDDYSVGLKYNLPMNCPVDGKGIFFENIELFGGQFIFKANANIIEVLKQNNTLLHYEPLEHSYPHCWRHKTPVIFRATPQWFVSMEQKGLRSIAKTAISKVKWIPDWGQGRINLMVDGRPDWCISRQRFWGVPITLFVHKQSGKLHPETKKLINVIAKLIEKLGIDAWFELNAKDLPDFNLKDYEKTSDILDVWFDSGVSHFAVLDTRVELASGNNEEKPIILYLEGSDQYRGWFQSSLLSACAIKGEAPYHQVLTHGFTVDQNGKKMSKSLGNVVSPQKVINSLGADILRLWIASTDYTGEMCISDEILKRSVDSYRRIRNTMRFMLANMYGFDPNKDLLANDKILDLDKWIIAKAMELQTQIKKNYNDYHFHLVCKDIVNFCTNDLGSFYFDIIKDRQYTCQQKSQARLSVQTALYHIANAMVRWISPILSFTAEEVWQHMPDKPQKSIFLQEYYTGFSSFKFLASDYTFDEVRSKINPHIRREIENLRSKKIIGSSLEVDIDFFCNNYWYELLYYFGQELKFLFITSSARLNKLKCKSNNSFTIDKGLSFVVSKSSDEKCVRCWHYNKTVGTHKQHEQLCARCYENVFAGGEKRQFV